MFQEKEAGKCKFYILSEFLFYFILYYLFSWSCWFLSPLPTSVPKVLSDLRSAVLSKGAKNGGGGEGKWRYLGAPLSHLYINTDPVNALASSAGNSEEQVRLQKTSCRSEAEPRARAGTRCLEVPRLAARKTELKWWLWAWTISCL